MTPVYKAQVILNWFLDLHPVEQEIHIVDVQLTFWGTLLDLCCEEL